MDDNQNNPDMNNNNQQNTQGDPTQQQQYSYQNQQQNQQQQYNQQQNYNQQQYPPQQPYQQQPYPPQQGMIQKSKVAAGLLGIFLGSLGVHNFYLGYTGKAVAQLLITLLTCGFGSVVSGIWGFIEGILILTGSIAVDGYGCPLGQ